MRRCFPAVALAATLAILSTAPSAHTTGHTTGLTDELVAGPFDGAVGLLFGHHDEMFVWERSGRVWVVDENGFKSPTPVVDVSEEVGSWGDHGLLGFALDPDVHTNGHVYLFYAVDYHHLTQFGAPGYDPLADAYGIDTILRLTRYTLAHPHDPAAGVDPASRKVLVGETLADGIPACGTTHGEGSIVFGEDGTLMISAGDGFTHATSGTCLSDGILEPKEDIERYRSQLVDSMNGKVLRLDPATGEGVPSNPFFDPAEPAAPRSRVWLLGLRNPFRMTLRPGTGNPDPLQADPGTLYIGDVGSTEQEELNVAPTGGMNFGWPIYEGQSYHPLYAIPDVANPDAPNPLFGQTIPGVGLCTQELLLFKQLLLPESLAPAPALNPCDPALAIDPALVHVHTGPELTWEHTGSAFVKGFDPGGDAIEVELGSAGATVPGPSFQGNCAIGGAWYEGTAFPAGYDGSYFFADFGAGWIRNAVFDANDRVTEVRDFADGIGPITAIAVDPGGEGVHYINLFDDEAGLQSTVRRLSFAPSGAPTANAAPGVVFGPEPLEVAFDGSTSTDPDGAPLEYLWNFADGTPPSRLVAPTHVFPSVDVSLDAVKATKAAQLPPTGPTPPGGPASVLTDGEYPEPGNPSPFVFHHTWHVDGNGQPDKNGVDWIAYVFPEERSFRAIAFQEGKHLPPDGGWFESLGVQVRDAVTGQWRPVAGLESFPPYPGLNSVDFELFELRFQEASGDAIRLIGEPGGTFEFVTAAELRVISPGEVGVPAAYDVTLRVTDAEGLSDDRTVTVSINNTPPQAIIASPLNGSTFSNAVPMTVPLVGAPVDAEHGPADLTCEWRVYLHHENHIHPEAFFGDCGADAIFFPHGLDGDTIFYELQYTVRDAAGLEATTSHWLLPDNDCNLNGQDDAQDILLGLSLDLDGNLVPDECELDCNGDGLSNAAALVVGVDEDADADGVPDDCEPQLLQPRVWQKEL